MKKFITAIAATTIAAGFALSTPAVAGTGYDSTLSAPLSGAVKLDVQLSEDLAHRANNLPEKLSDRSGAGFRSSGFGGNGYYGEKDLNRLTERLEERLTQQLTKRGVSIDPNAATVLRVTLTDARNNRPTFMQLSKEPGLSYRSVANGGATIEAELIQAGGTPLGTMDYRWYENDIRDAQYRGTWTDAKRAMDRFAKKAAKDLVSGNS